MTPRWRALRPAIRRFSSAVSQSPSEVTAWASCLDAEGVAAARAPATHAVGNQAPFLSDYDAFAADPSLSEALVAAGAEWAAPQLHEFGSLTGSAAWQEEARLANTHSPRLVTHDRQGRHVDVVEYHPSYHRVLGLSIEHGVAAGAWDSATAGKPGVHTARGVHMHLMYQLEQGTCCPSTMTFAAYPAIATAGTDAIQEAWLPRLTSRVYDPVGRRRDGPMEPHPWLPTSTSEPCRMAHLPHGSLAAYGNWPRMATGRAWQRDVPLDAKNGATMGMSMTEKQGASSPNY